MNAVVNRLASSTFRSSFRVTSPSPTFPLTYNISLPIGSYPSYAVTSTRALSQEGALYRTGLGLTGTMVAKSNTQLDYSSQDDGPRIMPDTAHEVSAILLLTMNGRKVPIGNIRDDFDDLANVMVRLGTKVSNGYPSSIGFRVLLRTDVPKNGNSGSIEDNYHLMSCRFDPQYGEISYMRATEEDKQELVDVSLIVSSFLS